MGGSGSGFHSSTFNRIKISSGRRRGGSSYHRRSSGGSGHLPGWSYAVAIVVSIAIIVAIILLVVFLPSADISTYTEVDISPGEQVLKCFDRKTEVLYTRSGVRVFESPNGEPVVSTTSARTLYYREAEDLYGNEYNYKSYYLVPESTVKVSVVFTEHAGRLIIIKGFSDASKFMSDSRFRSVFDGWGNSVSYVLEVDVFDEYYVFVDAGGRTANSYEMVVDGTRALYDTENLTELCSEGASKCLANTARLNGYCVVVDYDVPKQSPNAIVRFTPVDEDDNEGSGSRSGSRSGDRSGSDGYDSDSDWKRISSSSNERSGLGPWAIFGIVAAVLVVTLVVLVISAFAIYKIAFSSNGRVDEEEDDIEISKVTPKEDDPEVDKDDLSTQNQQSPTDIPTAVLNAPPPPQ